jgi:hypothetical protein
MAYRNILMHAKSQINLDHLSQLHGLDRTEEDSDIH